MDIGLSPLGANPEFDQITSAIGRAISIWARVEDELANIFAHAMGAQNLAARVPFYAMRSFEARFDLTVHSMKNALLSQDLTTEWHSLANLISRKSKKRNEIAHCTIVGDNIKNEYYADPYCRYTCQFSNDRTPLLDKKQILERADGFAKLAVRIALFEDRLAAFLARPRSSALLSSHPSLRPQCEESPRSSDTP